MFRNTTRIFHDSAILLVLFLFLIGGCGRSVETRLQGKWVIEENPEALSMEFFRDGRVVSTYGIGAELNGTWQVQSDTSVAIKIETWDITGCFRKENLVLKNNGQEKVYRKIQ
jgi:hypothetical protein